MLGSLYAGIALANASANAVHALAYPLQGLKRVTHGVANALLLPYVMDYNAAGEVRKFADIAELLGAEVVAARQRRWPRPGCGPAARCRRRWASRNI